MSSHDDSAKGRTPVRRWTAGEDEALREGVLSYLRRNEHPKYAEICKKLHCRSVKQAKERWKNSLNPSITKGLWSKDEVLQLFDLIIQKGENWTEIQQVLTHRSMHCIKSKGRKLLGEAVSKKLKKTCKGKLTKTWTNEERQKLLKLHADHHYDMETICFSLMSGKSMAQAHRELILHCKCESCSSKKKELESSGLDFKLAWAVTRAKELKLELEQSDSTTTEKKKKPRTKKRKVKELEDDVFLAEMSELSCSEESELSSFDSAFLFDDSASTDCCSDIASVGEVSGSVYDDVMKDAANAKRNFSSSFEEFDSCDFTWDFSPSKKMRSMESAALESEISILSNEFSLLEDGNLFAETTTECRRLPAQRRSSVINALSVMGQCVSVN